MTVSTSPHSIANVIYGCAGLKLSSREAAFFKQVSPAGFIFFKRNVANPGQFKALVSACRDTVNSRPALFLIDQEGGRVERLQPPYWRHAPSMGSFGHAYEMLGDEHKLVEEALSLNTRLLAIDLRHLGLNVNCLPLLDVPIMGADNIIGDRVFCENIDTITHLGAIVCAALRFEGVLPVIKHIPGHGRGSVDSHKALPVVDTPLEQLIASDFKAFRPFRDEALAMTAHIRYSAIDASEPATFSKIIVEDIIRTHMGFNGLLMSDDLSMGALKGSFALRAKKTMAAGVDLLLHCNGDFQEMQEIAENVKPLDKQQFEKLFLATNALPIAFSNRTIIEAELDSLLKKISKKLKNKIK
jgi:beta-N-acetylhexosaminidase